MKKQIFIIFIFLFCLPSFLLAQEIRRPAIEDNDPYMEGTGVCTLSANGVYDPASGNYTGIVGYNDMLPMLNFHDSGGLTTHAVAALSAAAENYEMRVGETTAAIFHGFPAAARTYTALTLNANSSCTRTGSGMARCALEYSLNNGSTWSTLKTGISWTQITSTVSLPTTQDLTQVMVRACVYVDPIGITPVTAVFNGFDVWTSGDTNEPDPENPSRRRTVIIAK